MPNNIVHHPSSWRDPSGFIFEKEGVVYRQVNEIFKEDFDLFINSGCYQSLTSKKLLIAHENVTGNLTGSRDHYITIRPELIRFISYPYEWSFHMLKDAALLTLRLAKEALTHGLILKDATPYNIQWHKGGLTHIDTLSFEKYEEQPWIAYRQFCESFLGPLIIMHYSKRQLPGLLLAWPNGMPLAEIASLLPKRSKFWLHAYLHIHLHAKYAQKASAGDAPPKKLPKNKLVNLLSSLEILVDKLNVPDQTSAWSEYYEEAGGRNDYLEQKSRIIKGWLGERSDIKTAADLGANEGEFSKLLAQFNIETLAADFDPYCIDRLYSEVKRNRVQNLQPLILDLSSPTPAIGVNNEERSSFLARSCFDLVMALAVIHHLCIGKNIPFQHCAKMFAAAGRMLLIEFVPKADEKIKLMLRQKRDIYNWYSEELFIEAFQAHFKISKRTEIPGSGRILFLMERHAE